MVSAPILITADLDNAQHRALILEMTREYFHWMSGEIQSAIGQTINEILGMDHDVYLADMLNTFCAARPPDTIFHLAECNGEVAGMGGLRCLADGAAEIVRIYTRPAFRGRGIGTLMVSRLVEDARCFGYHSVRLDTGPFMRSAQRIYKAAGFEAIAPYAGAEPPEVLQPIWLYMEKKLSPGLQV
jgi:GNAT superfamily N-acetyltransferase